MRKSIKLGLAGMLLLSGCASEPEKREDIKYQTVKIDGAERVIKLIYNPELKKYVTDLGSVILQKY